MIFFSTSLDFSDIQPARMRSSRLRSHQQRHCGSFHPCNHYVPNFRMWFCSRSCSQHCSKHCSQIIEGPSELLRRDQERVACFRLQGLGRSAKEAELPMSFSLSASDTRKSLRCLRNTRKALRAKQIFTYKRLTEFHDITSRG